MELFLWTPCRSSHSFIVVLVIVVVAEVVVIVVDDAAVDSVDGTVDPPVGEGVEVAVGQQSS